MAQLERADKYLFVKLAEYTRSGIRGPIPSGLPLDGFIQKILDSYAPHAAGKVWFGGIFLRGYGF